MGLELLVDHKALDPAQWTIQKVFFQGCYYDSLAQLEEQFEAGQVNAVARQWHRWVLVPEVPGAPRSGSPFYSSILRAPASVSRAVKWPPHCGLSPLASELSVVLGSLMFDSEESGWLMRSACKRSWLPMVGILQ